MGYPGVEGAFSHIAASRIFPGKKQQAFVTFEEVFRAVQDGAVQAGVVPFENSYTGEVGEVLDLLWRYDCSIVEMYDLDIRQNLLALPGARLEDIRQVYSHHQAISQCQTWLAGRDFEVVPYPNTALAAKYVSECGDCAKAAIASADTAALYGLSILARDINTSAQNVTRFVVLSRTPQHRGNRFNLVFTVRHDAGALARAMQIIAAAASTWRAFARARCASCPGNIFLCRGGGRPRLPRGKGDAGRACRRLQPAEAARRLGEKRGGRPLTPPAAQEAQEAQEAWEARRPSPMARGAIFAAARLSFAAKSFR